MAAQVLFQPFVFKLLAKLVERHGDRAGSKLCWTRHGRQPYALSLAQSRIGGFRRITDRFA